MTKTRTAQDIIDSLHIPTLPESVVKVRELLLQDGVGIVEVAEELARDPPLTALVLRTANSAQIGANEPKISIQAATAVIGLRGVAAAVLRAGIIRAFEHLDAANAACVREVWRHSIEVATVAEHLARSCRNRSADFMPRDYYTCGLLHDIGQVVLFDNFGEQYAQLLRERSPSTSLVHAEAEGLFGLDHAEIGALAAQKWHLPAPIPDIVKFHHRPMDKPSISEATMVIACADEIARALDVEPDVDPAELARELKLIPQGCKSPGLVAAIVHAQKCRASAVT